MFLWWRLFSGFADSLKVLGGGIHFNLIESFLVVRRWWCRCSFSLLKLINIDVERAIIKIFQNIFSTSLNCLYNFVVGAFSTPSHAFFFQFFSLQPCYLCHIDWGNFVLPLQSVLQKQPLVVFCKKKFTENRLCWSLFLIKLQGLRTVTLLKRRDSSAGVFLWNLQKF